MAYVQGARATRPSLIERLHAAFETLREKRAKARIYRATINELSALSDRELNDLGISRSMIKSIATEAAYGK